jgi:hypothetical protein
MRPIPIKTGSISLTVCGSVGMNKSSHGRAMLKHENRIQVGISVFYRTVGGILW